MKLSRIFTVPALVATAMLVIAGCQTPSAKASSGAGSDSNNVSVQINPTLASASNWTVSKDIFGKFLEMNGTQVYPGIYAQYLANGSFEQWYTLPQGSGQTAPPWWQRSSIIYRDTPTYKGVAYPWQPVEGTSSIGTSGVVEYSVQPGGVEGAAKNPLFQQVVITNKDTTAGILQRVALPDERTRSYNVSFSVKGSVPFAKVLLEDSSGKILAQTQVSVSQQWTRHKVNLHLSGLSSTRYMGSPFGEYQLAFVSLGSGTLDLDWATLIPGDAVDGKFNPTTIQLLKEYHVTSIRWGGNYSSQYEWKNGIGPLQNRPVTKDLAWGGLQYNYFGTNEFLEFCKIAGVQPILDVAYSQFDSPQQAEQWVQYVKGSVNTPMGKLRAEDGYPKPWNVKVWQVGNETYGPYEIGHTTAQNFATGFKQYSEAMKSADPNITIIASGIDPLYTQYGNPVGTPPTWNQTLISMLGPNNLQGLDIHRYVVGVANPNARSEWLTTNNTNPTGYNQVLVNFPTEYGSILQSLNKQAEQGGIQHLIVSVGEWNLQPNVSQGWPRADYPTMAHASFVASMFNTFIRNGNIVRYANQRDNTLYYRPYPIDIRPVNPGNYTLQFYAEPFVTGDTAWHYLPITTTGSTTSIPQTGQRIEPMKNVPYVDAVGLINTTGSRVTIYATNRNLTQTENVSFNFTKQKVEGNAQVVFQKSNSPFTGQTSWTEINGFQIQKFNQKVTNNSLNFQMPPASVIRIEVTISGANSK